MGCGASVPSTVQERNFSTAATVVASRGGSQTPLDATDKDRHADDNTAVSSGSRRPAVGFNLVTYTDYRGFRVKMANATAGKVNFLCAWADNVLGFNTRNGGFPDPYSHSPSSARVEAFPYKREADFSTQASSPSRLDCPSCLPNRMNVSVYNQGASSVRQLNRSQSCQRLKLVDRSDPSPRFFVKSANKSRVPNGQPPENAVSKGVEGNNDNLHRTVLIGEKESPLGGPIFE